MRRQARGEREDRRRARAALPAADAPRRRGRDRSELAAFDAAAAREFRAQAAQAQATLLAALEAEQAAADDASDYDRHVGDASARLDAMLDEARARAAAEERVVASSPRLPPPRPELDAHDRRGPALPPLRLPESRAAARRATRAVARGVPEAVAAAPPAWEPHRERLDGEKTPEEYVAGEPFIRAALLLCVVVLVVAAYVAYAAFALWLDCRFRAVAAAWVLGLALCAVALLGIWGCRRVRGDLLRYFETDADAVSADGLVVERPADTWGQGLLEVVFFCFLFLAILCAIFGACLLANGKLGATFAKSLKETRPGAFERTFGDVSSARGGRLLKAAMVEFGSGLQWGNAFLAVVGVFFAVMAALSLALNDALHGSEFDSPSDGYFWLGFASGLVAVLFGAFGFAAALNEDVAALRVYERLGALCAALWAAMFVVITSRIGSIPRIVDGHCDVRLMSKSWWKRFLGCRKYANDALRHGDGFEDVYVRGAGEIYSVYCDDAARVVYAWEYNRDGEVQRGACGCRVDYYGCLNNDCCQLLKEAARTNAFLVVVFGALVLLLLVAMVLGARYMRDRVRSRRKGRRERVHRTTGGVVFVVFAICAALGLFAAGTLARRGGARSSYYFGRGRLYNNAPARDLKSRLDDTDLLGAGADVCRRRLPEGDIPVPTFAPTATPLPTAAPIAAPTTGLPSIAPTYIRAYRSVYSGSDPVARGPARRQPRRGIAYGRAVDATLRGAERESILCSLRGALGVADSCADSLADGITYGRAFDASDGRADAISERFSDGLAERFSDGRAICVSEQQSFSRSQLNSVAAPDAGAFISAQRASDARADRVALERADRGSFGLSERVAVGHALRISVSDADLDAELTLSIACSHRDAIGNPKCFPDTGAHRGTELRSVDVCERRLGAYERRGVSFSYSLPTCASAATLGSTDGICPSFAGWSECGEQDVSDVAVTSGGCKSYWYAFAILTDGSPRAAACDIAVSVAVDARGSLSFPQATAAVTIDVAVDGETTTYVVSGASGDVDAALAEVSFCPRCVDETYSLAFELTSPCAACDTNAGDGKVMTV
ncbi:hypothetical protein JL721_6252 [Aureococcus anophagefferens]|nr:hypothetical protein JL721_6252 [Aureococcus anophagefferens]